MRTRTASRREVLACGRRLAHSVIDVCGAHTCVLHDRPAPSGRDCPSLPPRRADSLPALDCAGARKIGRGGVSACCRLGSSRLARRRNAAPSERSRRAYTGMMLARRIERSQALLPLPTTTPPPAASQPPPSYHHHHRKLHPTSPVPPLAQQTRTTTTTARRTRRSRTGRRSAAKSTLTRRPRSVPLPVVGRHCSHFAAGWALPALSAPRRKEGLCEYALRAVRRKAVAAVAGGRCSRWTEPSGAQSPLVSWPLSFKSARTTPPSAAAVWPAQCARGSLAR